MVQGQELKIGTRYAGEYGAMPLMPPTSNHRQSNYSRNNIAHRR